jgi:carbamoyl-phosphate synthase large subunit
MSPTVIVTGAGGPAGVSVIRALQGHGVRVVGADADARAVGLRIADEGAVVPNAAAPAFVAEIVALAERTSAEALVSTVSEELIALIPAEPELAAAGVATWFPTLEAVERCVDKWRFAETVRDAGIPAPPTALGLSDGVPGPWVVKPRFGRGSRDVLVVSDPEELAWAIRRVAEPIVQTLLPGREFTADALVSRDGSLAGAVPRWRDETKAGISTKGRTFRDDALIEAIDRLLTAVGLTGPANVQGFVGDDGAFSFTEANPRFSGGLPLSLAAGADLVGEYLRGVFGRPVRAERLAYRTDVTMLRYYEEIFE